MAAKYGYFQEYDSEQFAFFRIPKVMITDPAFSTLTLEAVFLYGILLDRTGLSRKNGWIDEYGHVFIIFPLQELMDITGKSKNFVYAHMYELEKFGLVERKRQGMNLPNIFYVKNFANKLCTDFGEADGVPKKGNPDFLKKEYRSSLKGKSEVPEKGNPDFLKKEPSNTNKNKTDISDTDRVIYAKAYGRFNNVFLTDEELASFSREYPTVWMELVNRLSNYMASTGKKYENHYATLCLWAAREMPVKNIRNYEDTGVEHL